MTEQPNSTKQQPVTGQSVSASLAASIKRLQELQQQQQVHNARLKQKMQENSATTHLSPSAMRLGAAKPVAINPQVSSATPASSQAQQASGRKHIWSIPDQEYGLLRQTILDLLDLDLIHYRTQQMERRLTTLLERRQANSWQEYTDRLRSNASELAHFQDFITINVTSFFRDAEKWDHLWHTVLPTQLQMAVRGGLHAWSVGCSIGAEAYTLGMILNQVSPGMRHRIWATDIDAPVMRRGAAGQPYYRTEMRELPEQLFQAGLAPTSDRAFRVTDRLRSMVRFDHFNLLKDESPRRFDLVMCRNVVIYFTSDVKSQIYQRLARALKPGGMLFIGSTETISNYKELGFTYCAPAFYRYEGNA